MAIQNASVGTLTKTQAAAVTATTTNGTALDIRDWDGIAIIVLDAKNVAGVTPTLDVKIQDSADGSTGWADVTGAAFPQVSTAQSPAIITLDVNACKQSIRTVATIGGTSTPSFIWSVNLIGEKKYV
jgi:hypothetical protein